MSSDLSLGSKIGCGIVIVFTSIPLGWAVSNALLSLDIFKSKPQFGNPPAWVRSSAPGDRFTDIADSSVIGCIAIEMPDQVGKLCNPMWIGKTATGEWKIELSQVGKPRNLNVIESATSTCTHERNNRFAVPLPPGIVKCLEVDHQPSGSLWFRYRFALDSQGAIWKYEEYIGGMDGVQGLGAAIYMFCFVTPFCILLLFAIARFALAILRKLAQTFPSIFKDD